MITAPASQAGFTLIEAMVALAILGIASVGIIRAAEGHVDTMRSLERRAAAQWVAENALAELALGAKTGSGSEVAMLGARWRVRTVLTGSADPDMQLATVTVAPAGTGALLVTLRGFVDRGTITP